LARIGHEKKKEHLRGLMSYFWNLSKSSPRQVAGPSVLGGVGGVERKGEEKDCFRKKGHHVGKRTFNELGGLSTHQKAVRKPWCPKKAGSRRSWRGLERGTGGSAMGPPVHSSTLKKKENHCRKKHCEKERGERRKLYLDVERRGKRGL